MSSGLPTHTQYPLFLKHYVVPSVIRGPTSTNSNPIPEPPRKKSKLEADLDAKHRMAILHKLGRMRDWKTLTLPECMQVRAEVDPKDAFDTHQDFMTMYNKLCDARPVLLEARAIKMAVADESINERIFEVAQSIVELNKRFDVLETMIRNIAGNVDASKK